MKCQHKTGVAISDDARGFGDLLIHKNIKFYMVAGKDVCLKIE